MYPFMVFLAALLTLVAMSLRRVYLKTPKKQLRYLAQQGDRVAELLYRAVAHGYSLRALLGLLVGILFGWFFVLLAIDGPLWFAFVAGASLVWLSFFWLPAVPITKSIVWLAAWLSPVFDRVLSFLHPILRHAEKFGQQVRSIHFHTGLYDKYDLLELIDRQAEQADNRIAQAELSLAAHALTMNETWLEEILTPRRTVVSVSADETIGPILMTELHKSGVSRFPVYEEDKDNIIGILYVRDLIEATNGGKVGDLARREVQYLHEDQTVLEAMQAMLATRHHLFVVVNSFEEWVGIVTIEDVLGQMIGQPIIDQFDHVGDRRAVAARQAAADHSAHKS